MALHPQQQATEYSASVNKKTDPPPIVRRVADRRHAWT